MKQMYSINKMIRKLPCRISETTAHLAQQDFYQGAI